MVVGDLHCDTLTALMKSKESFYQNKLHIDMKRIRKYSGYVQFFAAYIAPAYYNNPKKRALDIIEYAFNMEKKYHRALKICKNWNQVKKSLYLKKTAAILSIEGGEALEGSIKSIEEFYNLGVRCLSLTWNHDNNLADGAMEGVRNNGLSVLGRSAVNKMENLGMMLDVSHISEKSFYDVASIVKKPFLASHSNARKLCNHPRNLSDEQIKILRDVNGVIGINFYPIFLEEHGKAEISHILNHIEYIAELIGEDNICLGSDFDGVDVLPNGIYGLESHNALINSMIQRNFSRKFVEKIFGANLLKFLNSNLGTGKMVD